MSNEAVEVDCSSINDEFWDNTLKGFQSNLEIDFNKVQNAANNIAYIDEQKCRLEYGTTVDYDGSNFSKMPDSGNHCQNNDDRLHVFKRMVENYKSIWDELDNKERNFVYTCVCDGYVDTLGLFFLNRLHKYNKIMTEDKYLNDFLIDLDNEDLKCLDLQDDNLTTEEQFDLPCAYNSDLENENTTYKKSRFPLQHNDKEKLFERCREIFCDMQKKIGTDKSKNNQLDKLWVDIVNKKNCGSCDEMLSLCNKMENLID